MTLSVGNRSLPVQHRLEDVQPPLPQAGEDCHLQASLAELRFPAIRTIVGVFGQCCPSCFLYLTLLCIRRHYACQVQAEILDPGGAAPLAERLKPQADGAPGGVPGGTSAARMTRLRPRRLAS